MELPQELLEPIAGDNPAGADLRYEPLYDEVKFARTEDDDIPAGEWQRERKLADYGKVIELTTDALANRTKDLQLAAWLSEALLREEGFAGFHKGLEVIRGLLVEFWDDVYPEIEDGDAEFRAMPLEWIAGYLDVAIKSVPLNARGHSLLDYQDAQALGYESEDDSYDQKQARAAAIEEGKLTPEEFDQGFNATPKPWYKELLAGIEACLASISALNDEGDERFGDVAPSYSGLVSSIEEVKRVAGKLLDKKLEEDPDPPEEEEPTSTLEHDGTIPAEGADAAGALATGAPVALASSADAALRVAEAARFLRSQDPQDPVPYALLRSLRWAEIRKGGDPPDPRLLEAPPTGTRTRLKTLLLDERWPELLEACEEVMATPYGRGWLDLQRYVVTAIDGLGPEYAPVRKLIIGALQVMLQDVPSLPNASLLDDSPTGNRQTSNWMEEEGVFLADGGGETKARRAIEGPAQLL